MRTISHHHSKYCVAHVCLLDRTLDLYFAPSGVPHPELEVPRVRARQGTDHSTVSSLKMLFFFLMSAPRANQSLSWASVIRNQLGLQQDQPLFPPDPHVGRSAPPSAYAPRPESAYAPQLESTSKPPPQPELREDAVAELLEKNQDVLDEVINHPFPRALGKGTASLDGFRYYMIVGHL